MLRIRVLKISLLITNSTIKVLPQNFGISEFNEYFFSAFSNEKQAVDINMKDRVKYSEEYFFTIHIRKVIKQCLADLVLFLMIQK